MKILFMCRQVVMLNSDTVDASSDSMNAYADKLQSEKLKGMERRGTLLCYFAETGRAKIGAIWLVLKLLSKTTILNLQ